MHHEEGGRNRERQERGQQRKAEVETSWEEEESSCRGRDSVSEEEVRSKERDIHVIFVGHGEARYFVCQCE